MKTTMAFKIDTYLLKQLDEISKKINMNKSEFIRQAILEKIFKVESGK